MAARGRAAARRAARARRLLITAVVGLYAAMVPATVAVLMALAGSCTASTTRAPKDKPNIIMLCAQPTLRSCLTPRCRPT